MKPNRAALAVMMVVAATASAHVGSPDVFYEGAAGPYRLLVAVRPPLVVPGVAKVEILSTTDDISEVRIVPLPLISPRGAQPASPDIVQRSPTDPRAFSGLAWLMESGSWQVRVQVDGAKGHGEVSVPVPAVANPGTPMSGRLTALLLALLVLLATGAIGMVGAAAREAGLPPGQLPTPADLNRARVSMGITALVLVFAIAFAAWWWKDEAASYARFIPKPVAMSPSVSPDGRLTLQLTSATPQKLGDLIPDHGHLMHLFLVRWPMMDQFWHLHPEQISPGLFRQTLPGIPAGHYRMFADIVHQNGILETVVADEDFPQITGSPLQGDDSGAPSPHLSQSGIGRDSAPLSDGGQIIRERDADLIAQRPSWLRFRVQDANGKPAGDLEPYMGMAAHAVILSWDGSVFAHIHPMGSAPMAAISLANPSSETHGMHQMSSLVSFPYGFPKPGDYRILVQIKRGGRIQTGTFDVRVGHPAQ